MNMFNSIKNFFKRIFLNKNIRKIEEAKEVVSPRNNINQSEKEDFFEIYNKVKRHEYDLNNLSKEQAEKVITILDSEIEMKKKKLNQGITELNILKNDNKNYERNRIMSLYKEVKSGEKLLEEIDLEDLKKIRAIFYEETKIYDKKIGEDIDILEKNLIANN